jgi:hypothetical protein
MLIYFLRKLTLNLEMDVLSLQAMSEDDDDETEDHQDVGVLENGSKPRLKSRVAANC